MAGIVRALTQAFSPSDTHCAIGENCQSAKYCPKDSNYVNSRCEAKKSGVSSGDSSSHSSDNHQNDRERKGQWISGKYGSILKVRKPENECKPGMGYPEGNYRYYDSQLGEVRFDGSKINDQYDESDH